MYANLSGNIAKPTDYNFFGSLTFVFSSDRSNNGKGFRFMYQILQTDYSLQPVFHNWTGSFSKELDRTADFSLIAKPADSALKARCSVRKECVNRSETFVTPSEYRYLANETRLKFQLRPRKSDPDSLYCVGAVLCHVSWKSEAYRNIEYSLDLPKPDPTSLSIHLVRPDLWTQTGLIEFFAVSESVCPKVRHRCELRTEDGRIVEARILQVTASPTKPASCHISSLKTLFATPIPGNGSFDATTIACRLNDGNFIKYRVTSKTFTAHQESQKSMNAWERPLHIIAWVAAAVAVTLLVAVMIRNARNRKKRHGLTAVNRAALKMSKQEVGHGHSSSASFRNNSYLTNHPANENQVSEVYVTLPN
ncbi:hypothetical protein BOX15_Mlig025522g1 [Macrostomum lignano]|uniref:CUB domain-containing protein n=1 Tax=Macrostomum lignano TaxID=282301 RepID=A0A267DK10_9PLAT|nr:hypothetical protein BOX15_Mlig025522g1 [Macrostomum lignano]